MKNIDQQLASIERRAIARKLSNQVPGTCLQRTLMEVSLARTHGIYVPPDHKREDILVWGLGIGGLMDPKTFVFDLTVRGVVRRANVLLRRLANIENSRRKTSK